MKLWWKLDLTEYALIEILCEVKPKLIAWNRIE